MTTHLGILMNALILGLSGFVSALGAGGITGKVDIETALITGILVGSTSTLNYLKHVRGIES